MKQAYAAALYALVEDPKAYGQVLSDVEVLSQLGDVLRDPEVPDTVKLNILRRALPETDSLPKFPELIGVMRKRGELHVLPELVGPFEKLRKAGQGVSDLHVTAARELGQEELDRLRGTLKHANLHVQVDEELLAGFRMTSEEFELDNTLRGRLERMKLQFARVSRL
jgi:F0F1-type ATP synthase delta subunit